MDLWSNVNFWQIPPPPSGGHYFWTWHWSLFVLQIEIIENIFRVQKKSPLHCVTFNKRLVTTTRYSKNQLYIHSTACFFVFFEHFVNLS